MNASEVVEFFAKICVEAPGLDDEQLAVALAAHGCQEGQAAQAVCFVPVAFARQFLDGMGIVFSNEYWHFAADGSLIEQGILERIEIYAKARELSPSLISKATISHVAFRSSEAHAVNNALNRGSYLQKSFNR